MNEALELANSLEKLVIDWERPFRGDIIKAAKLLLEQQIEIETLKQQIKNL
jgi:hypothetical protein